MRWIVRAGFLGLLLLSGCAHHSGSGLKPGVATLPEVLQTMGTPAMRWDDPDGRVQLAYPRGPAGTQTFMVFLTPAGRLDRIEPVLVPAQFARIENGKSTPEEVLRLLGPSDPSGTVYFKRRDELVWEWRYCDSWNSVAKFEVLFDATTRIVRTSYSIPDYPPGDFVPGCSR